MFDRIDRDVEQAIADYNESLTEEDKCQVLLILENSNVGLILLQNHYKRRIELRDDPSKPRSSKDVILEKETVDFWKNRYKKAQKARQKCKTNVDKRTRIRDEEKLILAGVEDKRENFVYYDGTSYTVRWSALPR